eukprot:6198279-Pleurochrysis_carterae.AAC.2
MVDVQLSVDEFLDSATVHSAIWKPANGGDKQLRLDADYLECSEYHLLRGPPFQQNLSPDGASQRVHSPEMMKQIRCGPSYQAEIPEYAPDSPIRDRGEKLLLIRPQEVKRQRRCMPLSRTRTQTKKLHSAWQRQLKQCFVSKRAISSKKTERERRIARRAPAKFIFVC